MEVAAAVQDLKNLLQPKITEECEQPAGDEEEPVSVPRPKKAKKIAAAEVDDDGWESGSIVDAGAQLPQVDDGWESGSVRSAPSDQESDSIGSNSSSGSDSSKKTSPKGRSSLDAQTKTKSSTSESKFLPSLSVGFIRGDSDSEFSDAEVTAEVRKNRRGQRARRASVLIIYLLMCLIFL